LNSKIAIDGRAVNLSGNQINSDFSILDSDSSRLEATEGIYAYWGLTAKERKLFCSEGI